jgi:dihydrofolate synthase/folylpolyglutamate synthase
MYQRVGKAAYKANLNNTISLDKHFGYPHKKFKTIHIAGTNGKGSVSHMLASILMEAGYKVGLYTSPHLIDFRERIRVNGEMVDENFVVDFVGVNRFFFEEIKPSFFEMTVAMAFDYFAKQMVDVAVVEVGLGGRLDSTNIINPVLSIITNIGLDHTDLLGNTLELIAAEKAGIIKPNTPVIISQSQPEVKGIFEKTAMDMGSQIYFADHIIQIQRIGINDKGFQEYTCNPDLDINPLSIDLLGNYQENNLKGVLAAIQILNEKNFSILPKHIKNGLSKTTKNTGLMGRWQIIGISPLMICDTGHNVHGLSETVKQLTSLDFIKLHIVIGMVGDKDIDGMLELLPKKATYYFTRASIPRAYNEYDLANKANAYGLIGNVFPTVKVAINQAKQNANPNDLIFIGGSTFIVADALKDNDESIKID